MADYKADQDPSTPGDQGQFSGSAFIDTDGTSKVLSLNDGLVPNAKQGVDNTFDFRGKQAYIWVYNQTTYEEFAMMEWFLVADGTWVFPGGLDGPPIPYECCDTSRPTQWSLSDLASSTIEAPDTIYWGGQLGVNGAGYSNNIGTFDLQTFSAIPEVTALPAMLAVALAVALAVGLHRERRRAV